MFTIYKYLSPSKRNYIGITKYPEVRKKQHAQKEYTFEDTTKFANAIRKYGYENFQYEVLETVETLELACEREIYWIEFYDSVNSGYNISPGGNVPVNICYADRVVDDIRHVLTNTTKKIAEIAKEFNVSNGYVSNIKNGKCRSLQPLIRENQMQKGSKNSQSKLSEEQAKNIRERLQAGEKRRDLQREYGVSKTLIQVIATNQAWNHVESDYSYKKKETNGNAKLTRGVVKKLKEDIANKNGTAQQIADRYEISVPTFYQIKRGKTWKDV